MTPAEWEEALRQQARGWTQPALDRRRLRRRAHRTIRWRLARAWGISAIAAVALLAGGAALPAAEVPPPPTTEEDDPVDDPQELDTVTLNIEFEGDGSGTVTSDDGQVDCSEVCSVEVARGETVELMAVPDESSTFVDWGRDDCPDGETCTVSMAEDTMLQPRFEPEFLLTVAVQGAPGLVQVRHEEDACSVECEYRVPLGTTVTLAAVELESSAFEGWDLEVCGGSSVCSFEMVDHTAVSAFFGEAVQLTVTIDCSEPRPEGGCGAVQIEPGDVVCNDESCQFDWRLGSRLTLTPDPGVGYSFLWWRAECETAATEEPQVPCEITMDRDRSVTAVFYRTLT